jgi:hypothetical protein
VAIESITVGNPPVPVPDNAVAGIVNVNIDVNEGGQRVTRVELYLGTTLVCQQNRAVASPEQEMELADFEVTCPVNTAAFNQTTGAVNFRNVAMPPDGAGVQLEARIFTVAGGGTNAAATARRYRSLQRGLRLHPVHPGAACGGWHGADGSRSSRRHLVGW